MDAIFRLVLTTSLYASVVGIIIIILKAILKNKINPQWHYIIWIVLVLKLLIPFGPESAISIFNTVPKIPQQTNFTQMFEENHQSTTFIPQEKQHIPTTWTIQDSALYLAAKAGATVPYIWLAGASVMLGWLLFTNYSLNRQINILESEEQKEYGKALLSVIENFNFPRIAPRLIGMVDDKKNIEKRIKMIKMMDFFRNRQRTVLVIGVLCVAILSGIMLTRGFTKSDSATVQKKSTVQLNEYNAATLLKFKSAYVGDNSNVVNLLSSLPFANMRSEVSLKTDSKPYGISVKYDFSVSSLSTAAIEAAFRKNATVIFALIDNVDEINFNFGSFGKEGKYKYTRDQLQKSYGKDVREYAKDVNTFETLLNNFSLTLIAYPEKYALTISSTPGIRILAQYGRVADKVEYSATFGKLLTWDITSGKINEYGQSVELPLATPVYWSPLVNGAGKEATEIAVKATILNKNDKIAQKQVNIKYDGSTYFYTVIPSNDVVIAKAVESQSQNPNTIDEAVSLAIKAQVKGYGSGEVSTEGHVILDTEEEDGKTRVYTIASFGAFGFENDVFRKVSGSGAISTVMTFSKNDKGEYVLLGYKEPMDVPTILNQKKVCSLRDYGIRYFPNKNIILTLQNNRKIKQRNISRVLIGAQRSVKHTWKKSFQRLMFRHPIRFLQSIPNLTQNSITFHIGLVLKNCWRMESDTFMRLLRAKPVTAMI